MARKSKIKVTDSCGCVFCDIGRKPQKHDGKLMHYVQTADEWVPCLRKNRHIGSSVESWLKEEGILQSSTVAAKKVSKPFNKWDYLKTKADMKAYIEEGDDLRQAIQKGRVTGALPVARSWGEEWRVCLSFPTRNQADTCFRHLKSLSRPVRAKK